MHHQNEEDDKSGQHSPGRADRVWVIYSGLNICMHQLIFNGNII